jgi:hypothetical protein
MGLAAITTAAALTAPVAHAQEQVLNLYSARHYQTDEALYANFTKATGIKINRLDGKEDELVERIRNEGTASPADGPARLLPACRNSRFSPPVVVGFPGHQESLTLVLIRRERSLIPADRRQQPQPQLLLSADSAWTA